MANTVISLKKSSTPSAAPPDLANGEIAINYADGVLYYKAANGSIASISTGTSSFGTVNASGTLIFADSLNDVLDIRSGNNIVITGDAINDRLTIDADLSPANSWANTVSGIAFGHANAAFDKANDVTTNAFTTIAVPGQSNIVAAISDTLTFSSGESINITTDNVSKTITISAFGGPNSDFGYINSAVSSTQNYGSL